MSLQWTFVATFLYAEIFVVILLVLPFISAPRWHRIFKSRLLRNFESYAYLYFNVLMVILALFFFDSIREVRKYSSMEVEVDARAETLMHMKLFRAQRNFYIAGFAMFLSVVIKRLVQLISTNATLAASGEAALKQAQSASDTAQRLMDAGSKDDKKSGGKIGPVVDAAVASNETKKELDQALLELEKTKEELHHARLDMDSMRKQSKSTATEYDRLAAEYEKMEKKLRVLGGGDEGSKKDD